MSVSWGKGEVILASTPLLFTNYGVLDGKNAAISFCSSQMGGFPIVRTEGYMKETAQVQKSPFRYLFAAAASLGIVLEYGFHPALYDIYSPQEATRHSGYPRTGK